MSQDLSPKEIREYIKNGGTKTPTELSHELGISPQLARYYLNNTKRSEEPLKKPKEVVKSEVVLQRAVGERRTTEKKYKEALKRIDELEREQEELFKLKRKVKPRKIGTRRVTGPSETTPVILFSDWHVEELVEGGTISGMNSYNLDISRARSERCFQSTARLIKVFQKDTDINHAVVALLGDFFSGHIHEELMESNLLAPGDAAARAQEYLISGFEYLLKETDISFTIPCHSGNHGRMTKRVHYSTEAGNSLERYMYQNIAAHFADEPRLRFIIAEGQHTYLDVYGLTLRFLHGHSIRYGGGVGGLTIPVRKAVAQWNKARRADVTFFGHFHQRIDGGDFIGNGSLIGYNAFALSIKADFEPPAQQFVLISNYKGGRKEGVIPIRVE